VPAQRPQISIQHLEFAIKFDFNFAHAVIADTFEERRPADSTTGWSTVSTKVLVLPKSIGYWRMR